MYPRTHFDSRDISNLDMVDFHLKVVLEWPHKTSCKFCIRAKYAQVSEAYAQQALCSAAD